MPPLQTKEFPGFPDGMDVNHPAHELGDTFARYIQDGFVHQEGLTYRRGPLTDVGGLATIPDKAFGLISTASPNGVFRLGVLYVTSSVMKVGFYSDDLSAIAEYTVTGATALSPYPLYDSKPMLGGGIMVGISAQAEKDTTFQVLFLWNGANKVDYSTGTATVTQGLKAVTGSGTTWVGNVVPGMYLMDSSNQLVGTVASVESNTALTLKEGALLALAGAAYAFKPIRGFAPRYAAGAITVGTATTAVSGANTKFSDWGVGSNWRLYRASDNKLIGTVTSVTNNNSLTLTANAAVAMQSDEYFLMPQTSDFGTTLLGSTTPKIGWLTATYAELQWGANLSKNADEGGDYITRLSYSSDEYPNPEAFDMAKLDGDFIPITSSRGINTPIKAIAPAHNSLLVLKEDEAFAIYGTDDSSFQVKKVGDNGTLSTMSVVTHGGGVIWAGKDGLMFYDGIEATNLTTDTLGDYYKACVRNFDSRTYRAWGMIHRDHYFLHVERVTPSVAVIKGNVSATPVQFTIVMYIPTRSITIFTNMNIRGWTPLPPSRGQDIWFLVNDSTKGRLVTANAMWDTEGNDAFACDGGSVGPDFYIESKKYSDDQPLRKKLWKQVMFHYLVGGDALKLDTVIGLNTIGRTATSTLGVTVYWWDKLATIYPTWDSLAAANPTWDSLTDSVYFIKRIKFLKRNQYLAFRLYQNSTNVTKARLGPFALGFKLQRPGRI